MNSNSPRPDYYNYCWLHGRLFFSRETEALRWPAWQGEEGGWVDVLRLVAALLPTMKTDGGGQPTFPNACSAFCPGINRSVTSVSETHRQRPLFHRQKTQKSRSKAEASSTDTNKAMSPLYWDLFLAHSYFMLVNIHHMCFCISETGVRGHIDPRGQRQAAWYIGVDDVVEGGRIGDMQRRGGGMRTGIKLIHNSLRRCGGSRMIESVLAIELHDIWEYRHLIENCEFISRWIEEKLSVIPNDIRPSYHIK